MPLLKAKLWQFHGALKKRLFLLGCPKLCVVVIHKPLLKIFDTRSLSEISNPKLLSIKTLQYSFEMRYIEGVKNHAYIFSRYPATEPQPDDIDIATNLEKSTIATLSVIILAPITLTSDIIKAAAQSDDSFAVSYSLEDPMTKEFFNVRDRLSIVDGMLMYGFELSHL